jgi:hypothetical protein
METSSASGAAIETSALAGDTPSSNLEKDLILHVRKTLPFEVLRYSLSIAF